MENQRHKPMSEYKKIFMVALLCSLIGALTATVITSSLLVGREGPMDKKPQQTPMVDNVSGYDIPAIAREVTPAVVGISTVRIDYDFFYRPIESEVVGSGIIVDPRGYIITNEHVVGDSSDITVFLHDGRKFPARKLYNDGTQDFAVVKINAPQLTAARLGDSDKVVVGDMAVAIGNPLGLSLQRTVTAGIISALNRTVTVVDRRGETLMHDLIQTDASINPGNSGGPLVNNLGEVIGINTIKASKAEAIGFSIPINIAKPIVNSIIQKGRFDRPYLGIEGVDAEMAKLMNLKVVVRNGIYVADVAKGSPADKAGIKKGDIITKIDGTPVHAMSNLRQLLYDMDIDKQIKVQISREGRNYTKSVKLGKIKAGS